MIEADWLDRLRACCLYAYRLPAEAFRPHEVGGYWVAEQPVDAVERVVIDDLLGRHAGARIELRVTPSIWPFWRRVTARPWSSAVRGCATPPLTRTGSANALAGDRCSS